MVSYIRLIPCQIVPHCVLSAERGEWDYLLNETSE
ncbi:hypothetical protein OCA8868_00717 [Octadecabacter ascidiaceicola]|uniref:Uncharacterized protein n=1 Tax=Octadecabacter ascidiaceicola TaxID=1655543 RepID=A0A238JPI7_9RHOB|nr:hypothetical protein OCA8868_00717 [Octadecabacter ascidiaceicola]